MLGLAGTLEDNPLAYGNPPYLATVADERGPVLGCTHDATAQLAPVLSASERARGIGTDGA